MPELTETREPPSDWTDLFFRFLSDEKDASVYTQRNYRQALGEFAQWHRDTNESPVCWSELERNDFRLFLRQLGRRELSQAAIRLRFSALNSFYKFLMRRGLVESSPVKDVTLPKPAKRLPQFLTIDQMNALLDAPMQEFEAERVAKKGTKKKANQVPYLRDGAILETIYSCGLRIGEICRMLAGEIEPDEHVVNVHGKGKKERQVPIGRAAVEAIRFYWERLAKPPAPDEPVFFASEKKRSAIYPRLVQLRLKELSERLRAGPHPHATQAASQLRHASARRRGGLAERAGDAGPREPHDDTGVHARDHRANQARLRRGPPSGVKPSAWPSAIRWPTARRRVVGATGAWAGGKSGRAGGKSARR